MLKYNLEDTSQGKLYEQLYKNIKKDILNGYLRSGTRLPSKREMAASNHISIKTVLNAYEQLMDEGYLIAKEKSGYYVLDVSNKKEFYPTCSQYIKIYQEEKCEIDFTSNRVSLEFFPMSVWKKIMREVLLDQDIQIIQNSHFLGVEELRVEICNYLRRTCGMDVSPECVIIGANIEYLYSRLLKIFNRDADFAVESPGNKQIKKIYEENQIKWKEIVVDEEGIQIEELGKADILHVSPAHPYPMLIVMSMNRRERLLEWAAEQKDRYIIEDAYDSEFFYGNQSYRTLNELDEHHRVIYMNTFSKTLTPAVKISYMILPEKLMQEYIKKTNFFSNSAATYEQYVLAKFIKDGYYERYLNRLKNYYQSFSKRFIQMLKQSVLIPIIWIEGGTVGTNLLVKVDTSLTDTEIKWLAKKQSILLTCLSEFTPKDKEDYKHILIISYSDLYEKNIKDYIYRLEKIFVQW